MEQQGLPQVTWWFPHGQEPHGAPWEHSPHNPIVHTSNACETWWSTGHGTLVSTPDDHWYLMFHGYEKGFQTLGRQTLMEPVEWTEDGWFRVIEGTVANRPIPFEQVKPTFGTSAGMP